MVIELRHQNVGQEASAGHAARDRAAGCCHLDHLLAAAAGLLQSSNLDHFHLRCNHVEDFACVLTDKTQLTSAFRAAAARIEFPAFANCLVRDAWAPAHDLLRRIRQGNNRRLLIRLIYRRRIALSGGDQQNLKRQFQLLDFTLNLFGRLAEDLFLQLGDAQPQGLNQLVVRLQRRRHLRVFRLQRDYHCLEKGWIIRKICRCD